MSHIIRIEFGRVISISEWKAFCENTGIAYAPKIEGWNVYCLADQVEILLGTLGTNVEGISLPPPEFQSITLTGLYATERSVVTAVQLTKRILLAYSGSIQTFSPIYSDYMEQSDLLYASLPRTEVAEKAPESEYNDELAKDVVWDGEKFSVRLPSSKKEGAIEPLKERLDAAVRKTALRFENNTLKDISDEVDLVLSEAVEDFDIQSGHIFRIEEKVTTWKDIFPNFFVRNAVRLLNSFIWSKPVISGYPSILHRAAGYSPRFVLDFDEKIVQEAGEIAGYPDFQEDPYKEFLIQLRKMRGIHITPMAERQMPHKIVEVDINCVTYSPVETIGISISVHKE